MRPLWWEFPADAAAVGVDDQYMLGPELLVAPITAQNVTHWSVYFTAGARWQHFFNASDIRMGGMRAVVPAPIQTVPVYWRLPMGADMPSS